MIALVKLFGIVIVGFGVAFFVRKELMKKWGEFWVRNSKYLYLGGIINVLIGLIFLFAAGDCQVPWFVVTMGLLGLAKGIALVVLGPKKFIPFIKQSLKTKDELLRLASISIIVIGMLLIYSA